MGSGMILLVEDEPLIRMVTAETLADAGFEVAEAANATEAMAQVRDPGKRFDAAVIDLGLPDRSGDVLAVEMRAIWADLPIVIASGRDGVSIAGLKDRLGFVGKPYTGEALVAALRALGVTAPEPS